MRGWEGERGKTRLPTSSLAFLLVQYHFILIVAALVAV